MTRSYATLELAAHAERIPCPLDTCPAAEHEPCVNPLTGEPARVPHLDRIRAADQLEIR